MSDSVFYDFEISTAGEVAAMLFMIDNAVDVELFEDENGNIGLKFNDGFLKRFMNDWFTIKNKTDELKAEAEKLTNDEARTAVMDKAVELYEKYKTSALDNPAIVKKGTNVITVRNYAAFLDEE